MSGIVVGGAVIGAVLKVLTDDINQVIENAKNAGLILEMQAGREVALAIQSAQNAYQTVLNETIDKVDQKVQTAIQELATIVQGFQDNNQNLMISVIERLQPIVNAFPFSKAQPQVSSILPRYVVPTTDNNNILFKIRGNFPQAAQVGLEPSLSFSGRDFKILSNTTVELLFSVPISQVFEVLSNDRFTSAMGELKLPWKDTVGFPSFPLADSSSAASDEKKVDTYHIYVGSLPLSPGRITLEYVTTRKVTQSKLFASKEFYQTSASDGGNDDHKNVPYLVTPEEGWSVIRNSSNLRPTFTEGDQSFSFVSDDANRVQYQVTTIYHRFSWPFWEQAGKIKFVIEFIQKRDIDVEDTSQDTILLGWGESKVLPDSMKKWKVSYVDFLGKEQVYTGPDISNPYLKILNQGGRVILKIVDPKTLDNAFSVNSLRNDALLRSKL